MSLSTLKFWEICSRFTSITWSIPIANSLFFNVFFSYVKPCPPLGGSVGQCKEQCLWILPWWYSKYSAASCCPYNCDEITALPRVLEAMSVKWDNTTHLMGLLWGLNKIKYITCLAWCLRNRYHLIIIFRNMIASNSSRFLTLASWLTLGIPFAFTSI